MPTRDHDKQGKKTVKDQRDTNVNGKQSQTLLAAISLLGASLGVGAAADGPSPLSDPQQYAQNTPKTSNEPSFNARPPGPPQNFQSNQYKEKPPGPPNRVQSNQYKEIQTNQYKEIQSNQYKERPPGPPNRLQSNQIKMRPPGPPTRVQGN